MSEGIQDIVESKIKTNMTVSSIPIKVYKEFKQFALENAGDNYAMAIKILLDNRETMQLKQDVLELKDAVGMLMAEMDILREKIGFEPDLEETEKKIKTFGKGGEDDEQVETTDTEKSKD